MLWAMPILSILILLVMIGALVDIILRGNWQVKHLPKTMWIIIVILLPLIGSLLWFTLGREYPTPVPRPAAYRRPDRSQSRPDPIEMRVSTTEDELARLEREIEFYAELDRKRKAAGGPDAKPELSE